MIRFDYFRSHGKDTYPQKLDGQKQAGLSVEERYSHGTVITWNAISVIIYYPLFFCPIYFPPETPK